MGLAWMPDFLAADALADGHLQQVLPALVRHFGRAFGWAMEWSNAEELRGT